jgi:uncharacterized protein with gpF-like domain
MRTPQLLDARPPERMSRFLSDKGERLSFSFRDVEPEEHAVAFTVTKAGQVEVLRTIRAEVQRALDEGRTLDQFRADPEPRLRELGWWGRQNQTDLLTERTREVQLGSPRRLRTIYRSNMRSARAAGQCDRITWTPTCCPTCCTRSARRAGTALSI